MQPERQLSAAAENVESVRLILRHKALQKAPGAKLLELAIWLRLGCRAGTLHDSSIEQLADDLGVKARTLEDMGRGPGPLTKLATRGFIELDSRRPLVLYGYHPADVDKPHKVR